jgi:predicted dehydrogenase
MGSLKIAIIGTGNISRVHANAYEKIQDAEIVAACDVNSSRVRSFCSERSVPGVYSNHKEMLEKENLDAVSICTWNNSHAEIAIDCLRAGVNVLCEKPLAMNHEQAMAMKAAEDSGDAFLMVGFVRRFDKRSIIMKEFIENGRLGELYYAKTGVIRRCGNPSGWFSDKSRSGGGPLIDLGVHMIDLCRYLMGKPKAVSVFGTTFDKLGPRNNVKMLNRYRPMDAGNICDVEDFASAMIRFDNGCVLAVEVSFTLHTANEKLYCEIFGTESGAEVAPGFKIAGTMDGYNVDITPVFSEDKNLFQSMFDRQVAHFADCVKGTAQCISPIEDGVELMKILDGIYKSAETGREVRFD